MATGVLVVCLGAATRLVPRLQEHRKGYQAGLKLGLRSDTDDLTGNVLPGGDAGRVTDDEIRAALSEFEGTIAQVPPKFSAVHVDGQRAYDLARADSEFKLSARPVEIDSLRLVSRSGEDAVLDVVCGSGTYIRSLIRDLGDRLGCGAVMSSLRRTFIGPFRAEDAMSPDALTPETLAECLQPLRTVLTNEPRYVATESECGTLLQGRSIAVTEEVAVESKPRIAVLDPTGELFAFAAWEPEGRRLQPQQVFIRR